MIRKNFYLPEPLLRDLQAIADARKISLSEVIRQALDDFIKARKVQK